MSTWVAICPRCEERTPMKFYQPNIFCACAALMQEFRVVKESDPLPNEPVGKRTECKIIEVRS